MVDSRSIRCDEHTRDADELKLSSLHRQGGQETVNTIHGQEKGLRLELKLLRDLHDKEMLHGSVRSNERKTAPPQASLPICHASAS